MKYWEYVETSIDEWLKRSPFTHINSISEPKQASWIAKDFKRLVTACALAVVGIIYGSNYVRSQEITPCGKLELDERGCQDLVLRTNPYAWDLDITGLQKFLSLQNGENSSEIETEGSELIIQYALSENFVTTMVPVFQEIQSYSWYKFQWVELLSFIALHQFLDMGKRDMAEDLAEDIIFMYPNITELRSIFEKYNFISRQA